MIVYTASFNKAKSMCTSSYGYCIHTHMHVINISLEFYVYIHSLKHLCMTMVTLHLIKFEASHEFFHIWYHQLDITIKPRTYVVQTGENFYDIFVIFNPTRILSKYKNTGIT